MKKKPKDTKNIVRKKTNNIDDFIAKNSRIILVVILFLNLIFNFLLFDPKLFTGGDNAIYITLAKSIALGKGYKNIEQPGEPHHTQYPPGLPLLLAPIFFLFGENYILMKIMIILTGSGIIIFLFKLLRKISSPIITLSVVLITALNHDFIEFSHWILTEIPYLFFTILGIFLLEKFFQSQPPKIYYLLLTCGAFVFSFLVRPTGLAILLAGFIILLIKKKFKYLLIYTIIVIILIFPWLLRNAKIGAPILGQSQSILVMRNVYDIEAGTMTYSEFIKRTLENVKIYTLSIIPTTTFPLFSIMMVSPFLFHLFAIFIICVTIYGFFYQIKKKFNIFHIYFILYFLFILPWHEYVSSVRYFLPVMPLFFYFLCSGLVLINKKLKLKTQLLLPFFTGIVILTDFALVGKKSPESLTNLFAYFRGDIDAGYSEDWVRYYQAADWIRTNTSDSCVVVARKPELFYLRSKRRSIRYPFTSDHNKIKSVIFDSKVDYIVIDRFYWTGTTPRYLIPVINENKDKFEIVYLTPPPETYVLRVKK